MIKAYLSYRRVEGGLTPLAQSLLEWAPKGPEGIELKVDCKDAALSRPINDFLAKLKTSSSVVFLLNDEYFKSPWCLGELHAFLKDNIAKYRGFFIACEGWLPKKDSGVFFSQLEQKMVSHWRQEAEQGPEATKQEAQCFSEDLPEILSVIQSLNLPDEKAIRAEKGGQVWQRIKEQRERAKSDYQPCRAGALRDECRRELVRQLGNSPLLHSELARDPEINEPEANADEIVARLWDEEAGMAENLSPVYRAA